MDQKSFEDDMDISPDDEEAKEIEEGEFVKVAPVVRRPPTKASTAKSISPAATKRPAPDESSEGSPEKKAKKTKKAKA